MHFLHSINTETLNTILLIGGGIIVFFIFLKSLLSSGSSNDYSKNGYYYYQRRGYSYKETNRKKDNDYSYYGYDKN